MWYRIINCYDNSSVIPLVGLITPGGTVVEGTAGNTGIGLAHMCNALGYKCVIFMPNTQSQVRYPSMVISAPTVIKCHSHTVILLKV